MEITGQRLLLEEWRTFYPKIDLTQSEKIPAMVQIDKDWVCQRCGEVSQEKVPAGFFYCPACLTFFVFAKPVLMKKSVFFTDRNEKMQVISLSCAPFTSFYVTTNFLI